MTSTVELKLMDGCISTKEKVGSRLKADRRLLTGWTPKVGSKLMAGWRQKVELKLMDGWIPTKQKVGSRLKADWRPLAGWTPKVGSKLMAGWRQKVESKPMAGLRRTVESNLMAEPITNDKPPNTKILNPHYNAFQCRNGCL